MRKLLLLTILASVAWPIEARDNFLVIIADDLGVDGIGVYSRDDLYGHPGEGASPGPTPRIDALALEGVLFRNAYASPSCTPTRASTLTGRFPFRVGIGSPEGSELDLSETIIPEILDGTHLHGASGKWHIGRNNDIDHPIESGFDTYIGALTNVNDYFSWEKVVNTSSAPGTRDNTTTYVTTDNVDEAIAMIDGFGEDQWFVWLAFLAPHSPFHVPPDELTTLVVDEDSDEEVKYRAAVEAIDTEIGRLLDAIPESVLADTTIIFFGDNGTPRQGVLPPFIPGRAKGSVYEGGVNVPFIVKSPWIDPTDEGSESLALIHSIDIFATFAEIAGVSSSTGEDSVSFLPYLQDPSLSTLAARPFNYAESFSPNSGPPYESVHRAIRDEQYKLIWRNGSYEEFFDLDADRWEQNNLLLSPLDAESAGRFSALAGHLGELHDILFADGFESGATNAWFVSE